LPVGYHDHAGNAAEGREKSRKMVGRKMANKAGRSSFFCPVFFCWRGA
jgi:hypothetical protein